MKTIKIIFIILLIILFIITILINIGILYKPSSGQTFIKRTDFDIPNPICQNTKIECQTDDDCFKCIDNEKMYCTELKRNDDQSKLYGETKKYCLPKLPDQPCNLKNGGIWSWTGWTDTERMEWDCLCTYPEIAGGKGCMQLNPNVCKGGNWSYDATTSNDAPKAEDCSCSDNHHLLKTKESGVPLCVPSKDMFCTDKTNCETMYSNSEFIE